MRQPPRPETQHSRKARFVWAGRAGAVLLRTLGATWRWERRLPPQVDEMLQEARPMIFAFFHENILAMALEYRDRGVAVLVSESEDGEYISQILHNLGSGTIRGSSSRSGLRSLLSAAKLAREGASIGITPDGPKGPRRRIQSGVLWMAAKSGRPIVPFAVGARPAKRLSSWDRFQVPAPFARVAVFAGEPLTIPGGLDTAEMETTFGSEMQSRMDEVSALADRFSKGDRDG